MTSTNPYYFSGVSDPNLEIWALVDGTANIVMIDQNLFALKLMELIPFTNSYTIIRLSKLSNYSTVKNSLDNNSCTAFKVYGDSFAAADDPEASAQTQDRLFSLRNDYFKVLERTVQSDFLQTASAASVMMLMFGGDTQAFHTTLQEVNRFSNEVTNFNEQVQQAYESR